MANSPFDITIINPLEKPLSQDIDALESEIQRTTRDLILYQTGIREPTGALPDLVPSRTTGFFGDSLRLAFVSGMNVVVFPGYGFQYDGSVTTSNINGVVGLNDLAVLKPLVVTGLGQALVVPPSDPSNPRIDIVEVRYNRLVNEATSRPVFNPATGKFAATSVNKVMTWVLNGLTSVNGSAAINIKTGTPAGSPVAPTVTAGYIKIAEILVGTSVVALNTNKINDTRPLLFQGGLGQVNVRFSLPTSGAFGPPTGVAINSPPGVRVVVSANTASVYGATVSVFCGRADVTRMVATFRVESNRAVIGGQLSLLQPSLPFALVVDGTVQTALAGANSVPASAVAVGQVGAGWNIQPVSLATAANVVFDQNNLDNPLQISGQISLLGGV